MKIAAMSDLHLGSPSSKYAQFLAFMRTLPPDVTLVLNGDTVDADRRLIAPVHLGVIAEICAESFKRRIVWISGNHDIDFVPAAPNRIEFVPSWSDGGVYFAHGDRLMPAYPLYRLFHLFMKVYRACRAPDTLATMRLARSIPFLLRILKSGTIANATRFARKNGYRTVVCGHLHSVIDKTVHGVRYVNTGSWTEWPAFYLWCEDGNARLVRADQG